MIEREFISEKIRNFKIKELIESTVNQYAGIGKILIEKTPLGERIVVHAHKPGLVIGTGGETVKELTLKLKEDFKLESPQIEVKEIKNPNSWAAVVAKKIASDFERFGSKRYKGSGYRALNDIIKSGARGAEIRLTGVGVPGARARSWRFFAGYLKKSGDTAESIIDRAFEVANLKRGTIGIKVAIMPSGAKLPDDVEIKVVEKEASKKEEEDVKAAGKEKKEEAKKEKKKDSEKKTKKKSKKKEDKKRDASRVSKKKKESKKTKPKSKKSKSKKSKAAKSKKAGKKSSKKKSKKSKAAKVSKSKKSKKSTKKKSEKSKSTKKKSKKKKSTKKKSKKKKGE